MSSEPELLPALPEVVGGYEILAERGSDAVSRTFVAFDLFAPERDRYVLVRRIEPAFKDDDFLHLALDEAAFAVKFLREPHFVEVLAIERSAAEVYIVTRYVPGERLSLVLDRAASRGDRVPLGVALRIVLDACAALALAHSITDDACAPMPLAYRHLCPANVLVGADGVTRLAPLVLPPEFARGLAVRATGRDERLAFLAPEQVRAAPGHTDPPVDLFALGAIAWELFAGRRLFDGPIDIELLSAILHGPIPAIRSVVPAFSEALDGAVRRALAREPGDRYESASAFARALEDAAASLGGPAPRSTVAGYVAEVSGARLDEDGVLLGVLADEARRNVRPRLGRSLELAPPALALDAAGPYRGSPVRAVPEASLARAPEPSAKGLAALLAWLRAVLRRR